MQIRLVVPQSWLLVGSVGCADKAENSLENSPCSPPPPLQIHKHCLQFLLGQVESKQGVLWAMRQSSECRQTKLDYNCACPLLLASIVAKAFHVPTCAHEKQIKVC